MTKGNTREVILNILMRVTRDNVFTHIAVREALDKNMSLTGQERAFVKTVAEGTISRRIELDYIIDRFASVKTTKMKPVICNILRMAVYQMLAMDTVPASAACDEAVRLTQKMGFYGLKSFVNAVLRSIARNLDHLEYPPASKSNEYLSVKYSMPRWIVKMWTDEYGALVTEKMLEGLIEPRPLTVRLSTDPEKKKKALESLDKQGISYKRAPFLPYAYYLFNVRGLASLNAFRNGLIYPQDLSSMLVAEIAMPKAGDDILDLCAAPGGKSLHIADKMNGFGMVEARDVSEEKVDLIRENIQRADLINVRAVRKDATVFDPSSEEAYDIVICDLPCSGLGVTGRKPDIKYHASIEGIEDLMLLQRSILHNAASYVKKGGVLIYSTCTVGHIENIDNVRWFEQNYPFFRESMNAALPRELQRLSTEKGYLQVVPGIYPMDGFFIARFRKARHIG